MLDRPLSRRRFLGDVGAGALLAGLPACTLTRSGSAAGPTRRPNILIIMADDHGHQAISAYSGGRLNRTPHLDRLAAEGVRFERSFCTNSICGPSRAVMLTGRYSHLNGFLDNRSRFDGSQVTFPKLLQKAGYRTAIVGKWHLGSDPQGFDYWNILPGQGQYYNPDFIEMGEKKRLTGYVTDITTDLALQWLDKATGPSAVTGVEGEGETGEDQPFCLLLHHKAPHRNWMPAPRHLRLYEDRDLPVPSTYYDDYEGRGRAAREQEMEIARHTYPAYDLKLEPAPGESRKAKTDRSWWRHLMRRMTPEQRKRWKAAYDPRNERFKAAGLKGRALAHYKYQRYIKDYLRCIASVDENVGRVLAWLDRKGLAQDTLVLYTSDQGFYLGEHGWFDKRFIYEESLRMPLIVRYPREIGAAVNRRQLVSNLDFAPTVLDYAGVPVPENMQGRSLRGVLRGTPPADWRRAHYYHYFEYPAVHMVKRHYGVRTERYKLAHFYHDIDEWELYDLQEDPRELCNVYDRPEYADVRKKLHAELERLQIRYADTDYEKYLPKPLRPVEHLAKGCPVRLKHRYAPRYPGGGKGGLTNGRLAPDPPAAVAGYKGWQGFVAKDLHATIDLGRSRAVKEVEVGFLADPAGWVFPPLGVEFLGSTDGRTWRRLGVREFGPPQRSGKRRRVRARVAFDPAPLRHIRVIARAVGRCPAWHKGAGRPAWLFADEILVH